ncbi:hypothetical protein H8356DRAFT_1331734 [Neocallimastix lanati (nom. inval.)]|nr:hypothetical protein H8356DRAFT_1331734 [Neocallimastix sp. JGI-2020a]
MAFIDYMIYSDDLFLMNNYIKHSNNGHHKACPKRLFHKLRRYTKETHSQNL